MDNIIIDTQDNELTIELLYTIEDYFTVNIKVKSGDFAGASNFCITRETIDCVIKELTLMNKNLEGKSEIKDYDSDAYIIIQMEQHGHLTICGQIGGSHEEQFMKFKCKSDQTILETLIRLFNLFCNENYG